MHINHEKTIIYCFYWANNKRLQICLKRTKKTNWLYTKYNSFSSEVNTAQTVSCFSGGLPLNNNMAEVLFPNIFLIAFKKPVSVKSYYNRNAKWRPLVVCGKRELCDISGKRKRGRGKKKRGSIFCGYDLFPRISHKLASGSKEVCMCLCDCVTGHCESMADSRMIHSVQQLFSVVLQIKFICTKSR